MAFGQRLPGAHCGCGASCEGATGVPSAHGSPPPLPGYDIPETGGCQEQRSGGGPGARHQHEQSREATQEISPTGGSKQQAVKVATEASHEDVGEKQRHDYVHLQSPQAPTVAAGRQQKKKKNFL